MRKIFGFAIALLLIVAAIHSISNRSQDSPIKSLASGRRTSSGIDSKEETTTAQAQESVAGSAIKVSALALYLYYQENEVAADNKFRGKTLLVQGLVSEIKKDFRDEVYLVFSTTNSFEGVQAFLNDTEVAKAASIGRGSLVRVLCKGGGLVLGSPILRDCSLMPNQTHDSVQNTIQPAPAKSENSEAISPPVAIFTPEPTYSEEGRAQKIAGSVLVGVQVEVDGNPQDVHVVRGLGYGLDEQAIAAVERYKFNRLSETDEMWLST